MSGIALPGVSGCRKQTVNHAIKQSTAIAMLPTIYSSVTTAKVEGSDSK